jgi:hypothetical protein
MANALPAACSAVRGRPHATAAGPAKRALEVLASTSVGPILTICCHGWVLLTAVQEFRLHVQVPGTCKSLTRHRYWLCHS